MARPFFTSSRFFTTHFVPVEVGTAEDVPATPLSTSEVPVAVQYWFSLAAVRPYTRYDVAPEIAAHLTVTDPAAPAVALTSADAVERQVWLLPHGLYATTRYA